MKRMGMVAVLGLWAWMGTSGARADDWPQWMGPSRDDLWRETGILEKFPASGPKVLWRVPIDGGFSGPAVVGNRVFVMDYTGSGDRAGDPGKRGELNGNERVLCFDRETGKLLWKHEYPCPYKISYPSGPRCTPTVEDGKVYALGAEGHLTCLDAASGTVVWKRSFKDDYKIETPIWGFSGHPLVVGEMVYCLVGGDGSTAVAFDKRTGKELWRALSSKEPGYSPPTLIQAGGVPQLIYWTAESINSLDPRTGQVYWTIELAPQYGMAIMAPRQSGDTLFAGGIGFISAAVKLASDRPAAELAYRGKKSNSIYPVNSTPIVVDGILYGVDQPGILRAVTVATGERLWEVSAPVTGGKPANSGTAFLTRNGDRVYMFNEIGEIVVARLSPKGYEELSRSQVLKPTTPVFGREVVWSHPAYAHRCLFARNDKELICVSLAAE